MTTQNLLPERRPAVIDGELVPARPNPHTWPLRITAAGLIATALASAHGLNANPEYLQMVVGADMAAIGVFLLNLSRFWLREERP